MLEQAATVQSRVEGRLSAAVCSLASDSVGTYDQQIFLLLAILGLVVHALSKPLDGDNLEYGVLALVANNSEMNDFGK